MDYTMKGVDGILAILIGECLANSRSRIPELPQHAINTVKWLNSASFPNFPRLAVSIP